jgi:hypothetical protein
MKNEKNLLKVSGFEQRVGAARESWEQGAYAASNTALYALLAECLDFYAAAVSKRGLSSALNEYLDIKRVTYNASTSLELKIIKVAFCSNDNAGKMVHRLHGYARVVRVAYEEGVKGEKLAEYIESKHGIDEIRRAKKDGLTETEQRAQFKENATIELFNADGFEKLKSFDLMDALQPANGEWFSLALVRKNEDGTGSVVYGTNNGAAVATVLALAGKEIKEQVGKRAVNEHINSVEQQKQENYAKLEELMAASSFTAQLSISETAVAELG